MKVFSVLKDIHGTHSAVAEALGQTKQTYHQWRKRQSIPARHYRAIVEASNGQIEYEDLIPK